MSVASHRTSLRLEWKITLRTPEKLFCPCVSSTSVYSSRRPSVVDAAEPCGQGSAISEDRAQSGRDRPQSSEIKGRSPRSLPPLSLPTGFEHKEPAWPPTVCDYERGERPPGPLSQEALRVATQFAMRCQCLLPSTLVVMRQTPPSPSLTAWRRHLLVGHQGALPLGEREHGLAMVRLEEEWPSLAPHEPTTQRQILPQQGRAQLCLVCDDVPESDLWLVAQRLRDLTLGSSALLPHTGSWSLELPSASLPCERVEHIQHLARVRQWGERLLHRDAPGRRQLPPPPSPLALQGQERYHRIESPPPPAQRDPEHPLVSLSSSTLDAWRKRLPVPGWSLLAEMTLLGLAPPIRWGLLQMGHGRLFQECRQANPKIDPQRWGELLYRWPTELRRKGVPIQQVAPSRYLAIASLHGLGKCEREAMRDLLAFAALYPEIPVRHLLLQKMGVSPVTVETLRQQLPAWLAGPLPRRKDWPARERFWMGRLMQHVRGALPGQVVRQELYRHFSQTPPTELDRCHLLPPGTRRQRP